MREKVTDKRILSNLPEFRDQKTVRRMGRQVASLVEPHLTEAVHGWRKDHSVQTAINRISAMPGMRASCDVISFFTSIDQARLKRKVDSLDPHLWARITPWLPDAGLPEGCGFSPPLANLYLIDIDDRFPLTRYGDNIVIVAPDAGRLIGQLRTQLLDLDLMVHQVEHYPTTFCKSPLPPPLRSDDERAPTTQARSERSSSSR